MNRYSRIDNQSPAESSFKADSINVGRSAHDCSHIVCGNTMFGLLAPVLTMEVVPNEDIDIRAAALLEFRNPTSRQLFNSCRVFFHAYYNRLIDQWEGAKNWLDNGRSGKLNLSRPNLIYHSTFTDSGVSVEVDANTPMSLLNFMGLPASHMQDELTSSHDKQIPLRAFQTSISHSETDEGVTTVYQKFDKLSEYVNYFPADACMAYQRNWRDYYSNKNLLQNNKFWFPDNEEHFILSYDCEDAVCINYEDENLAGENEDIVGNLLGASYNTVDEDFASITPEPNNPNTNLDEYTFVQAPNLAAIKFRQFRGDRFVTASPFPDLIRGDIPTLQLTNDNFVRAYVTKNGESTDLPKEYKFDGSQTLQNIPVSRSLIGEFGGSLGDADDNVRFGLVTPESTVTMSDIYTLETLTAFRKRMGMTNGDYDEMIKSQYGVSPKVRDHKGTYLGGFYQDFAFSAVTQQSESGSTPLGTKAGQGVSSGAGNITSFHTPDFGWIQVYMSVVPDVYYTQGIPRQFSKKSNLEMYFPIFNNLPAQGIRNDELFITDNSTNNASPFAYEDRYAEFKSIPNRVTGFMALSHSVAAFDSARIMSRRFESLPALNSAFVTMIPENIDMEVFSVVDEPPLDFSVGFNIRRVFPGPYTAIEGSLSSPLLNRA